MTDALTPRSRLALERKEQPHYVYQFWSRGICIYVGCTSNLGQRLTAHQRKEWWCSVREVKAAIYPDKYTALDIERDLIQEHDPWINKQAVLAR